MAARIDKQIKDDFAATFNPRAPSFANVQAGGASTAPSPTIARVVAPQPVTSQLKRDYAGYFGGNASAQESPAAVASAAPLRRGGLLGAAQTIAGMAPMATPGIPSLVPPNGGRAPGGPFDPASFNKPPAAPTAPAAYDASKANITAPDVALKNATTTAPTGYGAGQTLTRALPQLTSAVNSGLGTMADAGVRAYGAADNFLRGAVGAQPVKYPEHPVLRAMANNGMVQVASPSEATAQAPGAPGAGAATANPAARAATAIAAAAPTAAPPATGAPVRPAAAALPGQMQNGVRVFSDGTGNGPAATLTRSDIDALAAGPRLSRADAGPGGGIASEAAGGTIALGAGPVALTRPGAATAGVAYDGVRADNIEAQRMAASDAASIATRDTRSTLGRAARAAAIDANSSFGTPASRRAAYAAALQGLNDAASAGVRPQADLSAEALRDAGATAREGQQQAGANTRADLAARTDLASAQLTRPAPSTITLEDGTLGVVGPDGNVRQSVGPDGKPARPAATRKDIDQGAYAKMVETNVSRLLGIDPISGLIPDGGKGRAPTAQELESATAAASQIADRSFGRAGGGNAAQAKPSKQEFLATARQANPGVSDADLEKYYAKNYGA